VLLYHLNCDYFYQNNSDTRYIMRGGTSNHGSLAGIFCTAIYYLSNSAVWYFGAALSFK